MTPKKRKIRKLLEKKRAALLNPKSKGWDAGTDRLLAELHTRRARGKRSDADIL
jgi:hypothetical protein